MFGLQFLFSTALWALPLAGLPLLVHLIVRRRAPVVPFSTLRFVHSSLRRTAGRRRVQRWGLLGCRMALLALLIWAVAQPTRRLAANWVGNPSVAAAIVVDTSHSMGLRDGQTPLIAEADQAVNQLISQNLQNGQVAIFTSEPNPADEEFQPAATVLTNWRPLGLQPALSPLADRVAAAVESLQKRSESQKWLIVISDLQRREFPGPLPRILGIRTVLLDLHPHKASSAAILDVRADPAQPRMGIPGQVAVEVGGRPGESVAVNLSVDSLGAGEAHPAAPALPLAHLDSAGRATLRVPFTFSGSQWMVLAASLQTPDRLPWAAGRTELVHLPPPAIAQILQMPRPNDEADGIVRLALDPSQGGRTDWPINLRAPGPVRGDEDLLVANVTQWPDESTAQQWSEFARRGGILILFVQPGLEETWNDLPESGKDALEGILPGIPVVSDERGPFRGSIARADDPLLGNVGIDQSASGELRIDRLTPFEISDPDLRTILTAGSENPTSGSRLWPLLTRRTIGSGQIYVWSTLATPLYGNLATFELFLPMLVNAALGPVARAEQVNVELGHRLVLTAESAGEGPLDLYPPEGPAYQVTMTDDARGRRYVSEPADVPGIYTWKNGDRIVGYSNVQYPAEEADLEYREASEVAPAGPDVLVARSAPQLQSRIEEAARPQPRWSGPIAVVLGLLCLEMLMGSVSKSKRGAVNLPVPSPHVLVGRGSG